MFSKRNPITDKIFKVLLGTGFEDTYILNIIRSDHQIEVNLHLPYHIEQSDIEEILPHMRQELNAYDSKMICDNSKTVKILFGLMNLENVPFDEKYIHPDSLLIELPSSYGSCLLDFADGASCHMLNGGAPRMGKTIFLLYVSTILYLQSNSEIEIHITSPKSKDFYPLFDLHNVTISQDEEELETTLDMLIKEYKARNTLLYSPLFQKATDAKTIQEFYPSHYHLFKPIFLIIDEYARFADNRSIQKKVAELVQTAGYVNVHVIIATQRPDARNTLPANIKMGLMARICFKTADQNNSIVVLDIEGAESLPNIKGRAILLDGEYDVIQVPYLTHEKAMKLLQPYKGRNKPNDQKSKGSENTTLSNKIQSLFQESALQDGIHGEQQSNECMQPSNETVNNGWFMLAHPTIKR